MYGVRLPRLVEHTLQRDKEIGTDFREKTTNEEAKKAEVAYRVVLDCRSGEARANQVEDCIEE